MSSPNDPQTFALKSIAVGSTIWLASSMATTSLVCIPSLLRPLTRRPFNPSAGPKEVITTPAPSRPASSLQVPTLSSTSGSGTADGRLTPQPTEKPNPFLSSSPADDRSNRQHAYQTTALQFAAFNTLSHRQNLPVQLLALGSFSALAWRSSHNGTFLNSAKTLYAVGAGLILAVIPFTAVTMGPLVHKLLRLGGDEEKVEPYEDAPPDREAERGNAVEFLQRWSGLNAVRMVGVLVAAGVGVRAGMV